MMTPVMANLGPCIFRDGNNPNFAGHDGWDTGFLTVWAFSLTKVLCVAAMINRSTNFTMKNLEQIGNTLLACGSE